MLLYAKAWESPVVLLLLFIPKKSTWKTDLFPGCTYLSNFIFSVELSLYFAKSCGFSSLVISLNMKITRQLDYIL